MFFFHHEHFMNPLSIQFFMDGTRYRECWSTLPFHSLKSIMASLGIQVPSQVRCLETIYVGARRAQSYLLRFGGSGSLGLSGASFPASTGEHSIDSSSVDTVVFPFGAKGLGAGPGGRSSDRCSRVLGTPCSARRYVKISQTRKTDESDESDENMREEKRREEKETKYIEIEILIMDFVCTVWAFL